VFSGFFRAVCGLERRGPGAAFGREAGRRSLEAGRRRDLGMSGGTILLLGSRCKMIAGEEPRARPLGAAGFPCRKAAFRQVNRLPALVESGHGPGASFLLCGRSCMQV
jgi:hypothetical protein